MYASLLALLTLTLRPTLRRHIALHLSIILLAVFAVYFYRDFYPYATFTLKPVDSDWARIWVLTFVSVVLPMITPREYRPLDPEVILLIYLEICGLTDHNI